MEIDKLVIGVEIDTSKLDKGIKLIEDKFNKLSKSLGAMFQASFDIKGIDKAIETEGTRIDKNNKAMEKIGAKDEERKKSTGNNTINGYLASNLLAQSINSLSNAIKGIGHGQGGESVLSGVGSLFGTAVGGTVLGILTGGAGLAIGASIGAKAGEAIAGAVIGASQRAQQVEFTSILAKSNDVELQRQQYIAKYIGGDPNSVGQYAQSIKQALLESMTQGGNKGLAQGFAMLHMNPRDAQGNFKNGLELEKEEVLRARAIKDPIIQAGAMQRLNFTDTMRALVGMSPKEFAEAQKSGKNVPITTSEQLKKLVELNHTIVESGQKLQASFDGSLSNNIVPIKTAVELASKTLTNIFELMGGTTTTSKTLIPDTSKTLIPDAIKNMPEPEIYGKIRNFANNTKGYILKSLIGLSGKESSYGKQLVSPRPNDPSWGKYQVSPIMMQEYVRITEHGKKLSKIDATNMLKHRDKSGNFDIADKVGEYMWTKYMMESGGSIKYAAQKWNPRAKESYANDIIDNTRKAMTGDTIAIYGDLNVHANNAQELTNSLARQGARHKANANTSGRSR